MKRTGKKAAQKQSTLAQLEEICFNEGPEAANKVFKDYLPQGADRPYLLLRPDQGQSTHRTDVEDKDGITYESFSPPSFWEVPYAFLKARFEHVPKEDFMYHGGEEILIPISGEVYYHFYSNEGAKRPRQHRLQALKPGSFIVLNPQIPHHTWGGQEGADAWMIIRHVSDTASAISLNSQVSSTELHPTPRRINREKLEQPGIYALVAWGISEKIRLHRDRAKCRISQLAKICGIDPSHLSRIENADANASIETLIKVARVLHIGLHELIAPAQWFYDVGKLSVKSGGKRVRREPLLKRPAEVLPHLLHTIYWDVPAGEHAAQMSGTNALSPTPTWSWITLGGKAIFEIEVGGKTVSEFLEEGSVIHFLQPLPIKIQALQDSRFIQVTYSAGECACTPEENEKP